MCKKFTYTKDILKDVTLETVYVFSKKFEDMYNNILTLLLVGILILLGCSSTQSLDVSHGSSYGYQPGYPEVRFFVLGLFDENGNPGINISADIVYGSLVYKKIEDEFQAQVSLELKFIDKGGSSRVTAPKVINKTISSKRDDISTNQDIYTFSHREAKQPGEYEVWLTVTDLGSGKQTTRKMNTFIPDPTTSKPSLTGINLLGKDLEGEQEFSTISTYDLPGKIDSIRFVFQVTNSESNKQLLVKTRLIKFNSDTEPARPLSGFAYANSSIQNKGVDLDKFEVISENSRILNQNGYVLIKYHFVDLARGAYQFEVDLYDENKEELSRKSRHFSIKSKHYPSIKTPRELAQPLIYLMSSKKYKEMMSINSDDSLKAAIDRFWLSNIKNSRIAKDVISLYYERVEEANKQFTNFKEGWKTDPGMMYILFGAPWYIDSTLNTMKWSYSYNSQDFFENFFFTKPRNSTKNFSFNHFLLVRDQRYFNIEYQQRESWLNGTILRDNL